jgi:hypothetical protein
MTMAENLRLARPYLIMLAIVTVGRWGLGFYDVPYEKGTGRLSIVNLTIFASLFYGAFTRRWLGYRILQAVGLTMTLGLLGQVVILLSTVASYALGIHSYFNHPTALDQLDQRATVTFAQALLIRGAGLVANTLLNGIAGALGWVMGAALPSSSKQAGGAPI